MLTASFNVGIHTIRYTAHAGLIRPAVVRQLSPDILVGLRYLSIWPGKPALRRCLGAHAIAAS